MPLPLFTVDAFSSRPFGGNPAAICLLGHARDTAWMQSVAAEMNLSETAFLLRQENAWSLRWFTPKVEVDLCGHATLAASHILWETAAIPPDSPAAFDTRSGRLTCTRRHDNWIEMNFPAEPPTDTGDPGPLLAALGANGCIVGHKRNRMDYLVELDSDAAVRTLKPDMRQLATLPVRGVIVTARSADPQYDFVSRFFAPAAGIDEDPATGSSHCCLAPYWSAKLNKQSMLAYQASSRGGVIRVTVSANRVLLGGQAITVVRGQLST